MKKISQIYALALIWASPWLKFTLMPHNSDRRTVRSSIGLPTLFQPGERVVAGYPHTTVTDETTIKKIIEGETLAFANADLDIWSGYFVHAPYLRWTVSPTMSFDGWDALYQAK